ncbi:hypothetical protein BT69DRAFT_1351048 [Atractiella rhizophila]|nr:hypothetical protein BT69DRAFT_1351048 [Atractiella rhizophila]
MSTSSLSSLDSAGSPSTSPHPPLQSIFPSFPRPRRASGASLSDSEMDSLSEDSYALEVEREKEWEENVRQLQLLVNVVLLPFLGKLAGRKCSHFFYNRWARLGWSWELLFGTWAKSRS